MLRTSGIHHVSSIVSHPQKNIDFNSGVLGLRLVKQTLNYDDKNTYHFYYGNDQANTGLSTTFPMIDSEEGVVGDGQVGYVIYAIRPHQQTFWQTRLKDYNLNSFYYSRFEQNRLAFRDLDSLNFELIETELGTNNKWQFNGINSEQAIVGIHSAMLYSHRPDKTLELLTEVLGYHLVEEDEEAYLLKVSDELGGLIELHKHQRGFGRMGRGTVHHIAFKINEADIEQWYETLVELGYRPTEIKNRKYFKSIYFREKGGILIELATNEPGMLVDESYEELGSELKIPAHYVDFAEELKNSLAPVTVREIKEFKNYGYRNKYEHEILEKRQQIKEIIADIEKRATDIGLSETEKAELLALKKQLVKI